LLTDTTSRLKSLYQSDLEKYTREFENRKETSSQRLEKMRKAVADIRKEREEEHERVVKEKLEQQWRFGFKTVYA
jgi:soluble cytochrome b562